MFSPELPSPANEAQNGGAASWTLAIRNRVMVVEDEAACRSDDGRHREGAGFSACGPFVSVAEATAAARGGNCEAAVLDINLNGELVYPVADMLAESGVPFIFVTGYSPELVEKRFAEVPVVQKPVNMVDLQRAFLSRGLACKAA